MRLGRRELIAGLLTCPICATAQGEDVHHWNYEGEAGSSKWEGACATGMQQSPIDLTRVTKADIDHLVLAWRPQPFKIVNNGHTIQANAAPGSALTLGKESFALVQFHFHTPSEHALDGKRAAMEAHFVHQHASGRIVVIGVFLKPGRSNPAFAALMKIAPKNEGEAELAKPLDPSALLPRSRVVIRYEGSLTTPPCAETVDWSIYETAVEIARADIDLFRSLFPMNARPLQSINRRFLLEGI